MSGNKCALRTSSENCLLAAGNTEILIWLLPAHESVAAKLAGDSTDSRNVKKKKKSSMSSKCQQLAGNHKQILVFICWHLVLKLCSICATG